MRTNPFLALAALIAACTGIASVARGQASGPEAILAGYLDQARQAEPDLADFSAERGAALFLGQHAGGDAQTPACTSCHGQDPRAAGENVKTGKIIEPMAASANAKRYADAADVEKWFRRNCNQVLGRECTAIEKGDFITFMISQ